MKQLSILFSLALLCSSCDDQKKDNTKHKHRINIWDVIGYNGKVRSTYDNTYFGVTLKDGAYDIKDSSIVRTVFYEYDQNGYQILHKQEIPTRGIKLKNSIKNWYDDSLKQMFYYTYDEEGEMIPPYRVYYSDSNNLIEETRDKDDHLTAQCTYYKDNYGRTLKTEKVFYTEFAETEHHFIAKLAYDENGTVTAIYDKDIINNKIDTTIHIPLSLDEHKNVVKNITIYKTDTNLTIRKYRYYD